MSGYHSSYSQNSINIEPARSIAPQKYPLKSMATQVKTTTSKRLIASQNHNRKINFGNDYSDMYARTSIFPQTHLMNISDPQMGYPKRQRLHELKRIHLLRYAQQAIGLRTEVEAQEKVLNNLYDQGAQFDVVMIHGCLNKFPSLDKLIQLPIGLLTPKPSLLFIWAPNERLAECRQAMEAWGFRRVENIVYATASANSLHNPNSQNENWLGEPVLTRTTWHCLMGMKGTLRRSEDTELIHCNVDTDFFVEKPDSKPGIVPEEIYSLIENFTSMNRRLHIIPVNAPEEMPVTPRAGWAVVSPDILLSNLDPSVYRIRKLIPKSYEIETLRPRTPLPREYSSR